MFPIQRINLMTNASLMPKNGNNQLVNLIKSVMTAAADDSITTVWAAPQPEVAIHASKAAEGTAKSCARLLRTVQSSRPQLCKLSTAFDLADAPPVAHSNPNVQLHS
jgi:hypothetical protein